MSTQERGNIKYVHCNQLKKVSERNPSLNKDVTSLEQQSSSSGESNKRNRIEVVDPSQSSNRFQFLVKWEKVMNDMTIIYHVSRLIMHYVDMNEANIIENRLRDISIEALHVRSLDVMSIGINPIPYGVFLSPFFPF